MNPERIRQRPDDSAAVMVRAAEQMYEKYVQGIELRVDAEAILIQAASSLRPDQVDAESREAVIEQIRSEIIVLLWQRLCEALIRRLGWTDVRIREDVQDVALDAVFQYMHAIDTYGVSIREKESFLLTIGRRRLIDRQRREWRRATLPLESAGDVPSDDASVHDRDLVISVEEELVSLAESDPRGVQVFRRYAFRDQSVTQIAEELQISTKTAMRDLSRVRSRLRDFLEQTGEEVP